MSDYHNCIRERNALAIQLAQFWGWPPDPTAVLERLRGDRTTALTTFSDEAYGAFLGVTLSGASNQDGRIK